MKEYYFISGLPRSGSTLLAAILKQNPNFYADIASPVENIVTNTISQLTLCENNLNIDENQRKNVLYGLFEGYYKHLNCSVVFDSNRSWTKSTSLLKELFPYTKIICCVREFKWILDSFEKIFNKNNLYLNTLLDKESLHSVETRCMALMDVKKSGIVIKSWQHLEEGLAVNRNMILLISYDSLCKNPKEVFKQIYNFIDKPYFEHDFNNVVYENELFDKYIKQKNLHTVRKKVEYIERKSIIPEYVIKKIFLNHKNIGEYKDLEYE